ncbi:hypothetical protein M758_2G012300 [Ceratodon purpureus]|uniref:Uncharacterized protein n=1 Tax=Ceratodon purpureus TaxID=3225 RepID=A0A8T0IQY7_CERPU|nr:hypothetical protein KC19_2G012900 [Ceratodon purpureus]KAG0624898.1 hypothetical protein M758_2G012300 [Ceratodon purpureus]
MMREDAKKTAAGRTLVNHATDVLSSMLSNLPIPRGRKFQRFQKKVNSLKLTILCSFMTVLVLRGTLGIGNPFASQTQFDDNVAQGMDMMPRRVLSITNKQLLEKEELRKPEIKSHEIEDSSATGSYTLGPHIGNWDEQRALWLQEHPIMKKNSQGNNRILLVTGSQPKPCDNPVGDHLLLKSLKNKMDYCRLHDIDIFYNMAHLDQEMAGFWAKLPLLRKLMLTHPEVEWIWWMDSDAMFTDMLFELPMEKYENVNMVLHGYDEMVYNQKNWVGLNTGSFLFRNCQWSLDLLDAWAPMGPKGKARTEAGKVLTAALAGRPAFEADDQSALIYLLVTQKQRWANKVFLESQYMLHGYWIILVDRYEEMMANNHPGKGDENWPFVTHFVGCKPCGSFGVDYAAEKCISQMERAFNFGDNQILEHYGFQHQTLGTHKVRRLRNETADPLGLGLATPVTVSDLDSSTVRVSVNNHKAST